MRADTCIGYNTLFVTPSLDPEANENAKDLPEGKRLWSWLILTDDGTTILSIYGFLSLLISTKAP